MDVREFSLLGEKRYLSPILHPPQNQGEAERACRLQFTGSKPSQLLK